MKTSKCIKHPVRCFRIALYYFTGTTFGRRFYPPPLPL